MNLKDKCESLLWERASELSAERTQLLTSSIAIYDKVQVMRSRSLKLNEQIVLEQMELEYWDILDQINQVGENESEVENLLLRLGEGKVGEKEIQDLFPDEFSQKKVSKRKQRIQEEIRRLGYDPRDRFSSPLGNGFTSDPHRVTTGRGAKCIKGNLDPLTAVDEFMYRTADTHGGKVRRRKKSGKFYTTKGGRHIRKK